MDSGRTVKSPETKWRWGASVWSGGAEAGFEGIGRLRYVEDRIEVGEHVLSEDDGQAADLLDSLADRPSQTDVVGCEIQIQQDVNALAL